MKATVSLLTLYQEARGDGRDAMIAVGWVVLNRRDDPAYPDSICAVVRDGGEEAPCQFSYWCDGHPDKPQRRGDSECNGRPILM